MQAKPNNNVWLNFALSHDSFRRELGWGIIGGLVATFIMDLILVSAFMAAGLPPFTCFSLVGDTILILFPSKLMANSALLGAAAHYSIGPVLGGIFGAAGKSMPALRSGSSKKIILFAVLYAEIMSQPLLILTPIFLQMTLRDVLLWYGGSLMMHLIWGCALGATWCLRSRSHAAADHS